MGNKSKRSRWAVVKCDIPGVTKKEFIKGKKRIRSHGVRAEKMAVEKKQVSSDLQSCSMPTFRGIRFAELAIKTIYDAFEHRK